MRFLTIYSDSTPLVCIDLKNPKRLDVKDAIYYSDKLQLCGFISNYKNIFNADFQRTGGSSNHGTERLIKEHDIPKRLNPQELIPFLESLLQRGKDRHPRTVHPNSLANLKPRKPFTQDCHPTKKRRMTPDQIVKAANLRESGCSWRTVGDLLQCNPQTVRTTLRREAAKAEN